MINVSAPGKLMLLGEHAVVYGQPCIVTAVDERLEVVAEKTEDGNITIDAPDVKNTSFVEEAIRQCVEKWNIKHTGLKITTKSTFSGVYGFGSSAASTVGVLKALTSLFDVNVDNKALFDLAYAVTVKIQGLGSGFDVASSIYGGTLYFLSGGKTIDPMDVGAMPMIVAYSGIKSSTVEMVRMVREKRDKYPDKVDRIFLGITKLVEDAKTRMLEGDWERVGKLMDFNQEYLRDLGVSSEKLETLISAAKNAGAWGAKLSGAGGGDCMIALAPPERQVAVKDAIMSVGGQVIAVRANAQGVRLDTTDDQSEQFVVVDKDDVIVGYRSRFDCHHDRSLIHRTVGAVIFDEKGRVLLQKRSSSKDMGAGLWGISCAGHVRKGQEYEEALHRELAEELGVDIPVTFVTKFIPADEDETEMSALYKGISGGPFKPNPEEVERLEFFSPRELAFKVATREIVLMKCAEASLQKTGVLP